MKFESTPLPTLSPEELSTLEADAHKGAPSEDILPGRIQPDSQELGEGD